MGRRMRNPVVHRIACVFAFCSRGVKGNGRSDMKVCFKDEGAKSQDILV